MRAAAPPRLGLGRPRGRVRVLAAAGAPAPPSLADELRAEAFAARRAAAAHRVRAARLADRAVALREGAERSVAAGDGDAARSALNARAAVEQAIAQAERRAAANDALALALAARVDGVRRGGVAR